jgi:hypothetical protein
LVQAHPAFFKTLNDYQARWRWVIFDLLDWESEKAGNEPLSVWIEKELAGLLSQPSAPVVHEDDEWDFDPDWHSASSHIKGVAEYIGDKVDDAPFFSRAKGAFDWLKHTMDIDLEGMETRWRELQVVVVPQQVSDAHGLSDPQSLFAYLDNIRVAYVAGAFLAAISMCRAATEIMIRDHYNRKDHRTNLTPLIKETQRRNEFAFMRSFNLVAKVEEANKLLHFDRDEIRNIDRSRALIQDWIKAIQALIAYAPRS